MPKTSILYRINFRLAYWLERPMPETTASLETPVKRQLTCIICLRRRWPNKLSETHPMRHKWVSATWPAYIRCTIASRSPPTRSSPRLQSSPHRQLLFQWLIRTPSRNQRPLRRSFVRSRGTILLLSTCVKRTLSSIGASLLVFPNALCVDSTSRYFMQGLEKEIKGCVPRNPG
jgi:hypothetical protein